MGLGQAVGHAGDRESPLVDHAIVTPVQEDQVVQASDAAGGSMDDVVGVAPVGRAAGKLTPRITRSERPADRRRNRPRLAPRVEHGAVRVLAHA